jgi:hypothetical protein
LGNKEFPLKIRFSLYFLISEYTGAVSEWKINFEIHWGSHAVMQYVFYIQLIKAVLDEILNQGEEDVLIVSLGALMMFMRKEMLKRGFEGPKIKRPENGKLYLFEK